MTMTIRFTLEPSGKTVGFNVKQRGPGDWIGGRADDTGETFRCDSLENILMLFTAGALVNLEALSQIV